MVQGIRKIETALGDGVKRPASSEADTANAARRSLVAAQDIPAGSTLSEEMIAIRRPGTGLPPAMLPFLLGRRLRRDMPAGSILTLDMLE